MTNMNDRSAAYACSNYLDLKGIIDRCQESLEMMDAEDPVRPSVEMLKNLAQEEMDKLVKTYIPF